MGLDNISGEKEIEFRFSKNTGGNRELGIRNANYNNGKHIHRSHFKRALQDRGNLLLAEVQIFLFAYTIK